MRLCVTFTKKNEWKQVFIHTLLYSSLHLFLSLFLRFVQAAILLLLLYCLSLSLVLSSEKVLL